MLGATVFAQPSASLEKLAELKKDSRVLERIIGEILKQNFENPFAVAAEPLAAYLPGYGVVVSFHLKINRGTIRGFYGDLPNPAAKAPRTREEQVAAVRSLLVQSLADYGSTLKNLSAEERVSVCAHVEDRNELDPVRSRVALVATCGKSDLDLYLARRIGIEEFRKRVSLLEY